MCSRSTLTGSLDNKNNSIFDLENLSCRYSLTLREGFKFGEDPRSHRIRFGQSNLKKVVQMGWLRYFCIGGLFAAAISQVSDPAASRDGARLAIEAYPKIIEQRMHRRVQELDELPEMLAGIGAKLVVVKRARRWQPGSTIKVAFEQAKGDQQVRSLVQSAAMIWTQHANITLEFSDVNTGEFHEFSSDDNDYVADIRISFRTGEAIGRLWGRTVELTTTISLGNRR